MLSRQIVTTALLMAASLPAAAQSHDVRPVENAPTPLALQPSDGEHRMLRPLPASLAALPAAFSIKFDERNGGAKDFVIFTEDVQPGQSIPLHRHPHSEEMLFIHAGTGTAWLDGKQATIGPGSIIFIPPNTGVRLTNDGKQPISLVAIFSRPGFDKYQRDISVPAGETATTLTAEELTAIRARHTGVVIYDPPAAKQR